MPVAPSAGAARPHHWRRQARVFASAGPGVVRPLRTLSGVEIIATRHSWQRQDDCGPADRRTRRRLRRRAPQRSSDRDAEVEHPGTTTNTTRFIVVGRTPLSGRTRGQDDGRLLHHNEQLARVVQGACRDCDWRGIDLTKCRVAAPIRAASGNTCSTSTRGRKATRRRVNAPWAHLSEFAPMACACWGRIRVQSRRLLLRERRRETVCHRRPSWRARVAVTSRTQFAAV